MFKFLSINVILFFLLLILFLIFSLQAFALEYMNPLHNIEALEQSHLNDYIHPCIKTALWSCAEIYYTS